MGLGFNLAVWSSGLSSPQLKKIFMINLRWILSLLVSVILLRLNIEEVSY